jgi:DNA-directed RNA polymerase subunit M/transcription elongation factor TFIIS
VSGGITSVIVRRLLNPEFRLMSGVLRMLAKIESILFSIVVLKMDKILKDIGYDSSKISLGIKPNVYKVLKVLHSAKRLDLFNNILWIFDNTKDTSVNIPPVDDVFASMEILDDLKDSQIKTVTPKEVENFFDNIPTEKGIVEYVEKSHPSLKYYRDINERKKILIKKPTEDVVGGFPCKVCKSTNTTTGSRQDRSADEGATIKVYCQNCGHEGRL